MNYLYHYKQLIKSRKKLQEIRKQQRKNKSHYFEEHHIILKCELKRRNKPKQIWNGQWNRVLLTAREHFIAHMLLWKACEQIYKSNNPLTISALYAVTNFINRKAHTNADYKVNARIYEKLREYHAKMVSITQSGMNHHFYGKPKEKMPCYGRTGEKHPMFGKTHTPEAKAKISEAGMGRAWTENQRQIMREKNLGANNPMYGKKYIMDDTRKENISKSLQNIWEITFSSGLILTVCNLAKWCKDNNYSKGNIMHLIHGTRKRHKDIIGVVNLTKLN